jgi:hypothetical protein
MSYTLFYSLCITHIILYSVIQYYTHNVIILSLPYCLKELCCDNRCVYCNYKINTLITAMYTNSLYNLKKKKWFKNEIYHNLIKNSDKYRYNIYPVVGCLRKLTMSSPFK